MPPLRLWPLLLPPKLQLCNSSAEFTLSEFTANLSNHAIYSTANKGTVEHDIKNYLQPKFVDVAYKAADKIIQVTEENLATLFINCGHSLVYRVKNIDVPEGARAALNLSGNVLGYYPVNVLPSKTAIAPVNETFLPRPDDEREMCARTIYCTNIDKKVAQADLKLFFESICGEAESATAALNSSGVVLGSLPIRHPCVPAPSPADVVLGIHTGGADDGTAHI
uniref:RRM domain-containing protein n=1 Tax=Zea mays TaxID=4577 RepID=A0A804LPY5_MAIZE